MLKNGKTMADIKGRTVNLVELSVSHYLLARALETRTRREKPSGSRMKVLAFATRARDADFLMTLIWKRGSSNAFALLPRTQDSGMSSERTGFVSIAN